MTKKLTLADLTPVQRETYDHLTHCSLMGFDKIWSYHIASKFYITERAARKRLATLIDLGLVKRNGLSKKFATYSIKRVLT